MKHATSLFGFLLLGLACTSSRTRDGGTQVVPAAAVEVTPATLSIQVGQTQQLTARVLNAEGAPLTRTVTWVSSATDVVTVSDTGLLTGVAEGTATVTASADGKRGSAEVTVVPANENPVATVELSETSVSLLVGESRQLTATARDAEGSVLVNRPATWTSSNEGVVTVSATGLVSAVSAGNAEVTAMIEEVAASASFEVTEPQVEPADVELDVATRHQTMTGWEATAQMGQWECDPTAFSNYSDTVVDRAVNELGINRIRLELYSGTENTTDTFSRFLSGQGTFEEWRATWYQPQNDNNDPNMVEPNGFQFSHIDHQIETVITPFRQAVAARGEQLYVSLCYVDFVDSPFSHEDSAEEYAELILATFQHIEATYGWVPDGVEILLEPDVAGWSNANVGRSLIAAGQRLQATGYTPAFTVPSHTSMWSAINAFDEIVAMPGAMQYITELSYHRYSGTGLDAAMAAADRVRQYGIKSGMLEHIGSGIDDLWQDLTVAQGSAWQQFTIAFCGPPDTGAKYYGIDQSDPDNPVVRIEAQTRPLVQIFRHVRRGAVRHGVNTNDGSLEPMAFLNPDGKWTVIVRTPGARTFTVGRLPPGTYGVYYTTDGELAVDTGDVVVQAGQAIEVAIPAAGLITVHAK